MRIDLNGCIDTSNCFEIYKVFNSVGLTEMESQVQSVTQSDNLVSLYFKSSENRTLELIDVSGKLIKSFQSKSEFVEIPIQNLASGIYLLKINAENRINDVFKLYR